ncbi:hypothetical protein AD940_09480 [Gluconobacter thailandicus]|nr:hypothetical protein AD940_09480 [Gluconobacter thailandicus]
MFLTSQEILGKSYRSVLTLKKYLVLILQFLKLRINLKKVSETYITFPRTFILAEGGQTIP